MKSLKIVFRGGLALSVYDDALQPLLSEGETTVARASHVEPSAGGGWDADLTPSNGPASLGGFTTRQAALDAEVAWLHANRIN
jgi:hypothetical protein